MQDIMKLARDFDSHADFLLVYIAEAHAADEWPVGNPVRYNQPTVLSERLCIAQDFVNEFGIDCDELPLVVDDMCRLDDDGEGDGAHCADNNPVDTAYAMWPTRLYVVRNGEVKFKAEPNLQHEYKLEELEDFLHDTLASTAHS